MSDPTTIIDLCEEQLEAWKLDDERERRARAVLWNEIAVVNGLKLLTRRSRLLVAEDFPGPLRFVSGKHPLRVLWECDASRLDEVARILAALVIPRNVPNAVELRKQAVVYALNCCTV